MGMYSLLFQCVIVVSFQVIVLGYSGAFGGRVGVMNTMHIVSNYLFSFS